MSQSVSIVIILTFTAIIDGGLITAALNPQKSTNNRIANGEDATIEQYPYMVWITIIGWVSSDIATEDKWIDCAGSIFTSTIIITAAHCLFDKHNHKIDVSTYSFIRAGTFKNGYRKNGTKIHIIKAVGHPLFQKNLPYSDYDIAMLKLEKPLHTSKQINLIQLACESDRIAANNIGTVIGWGIVSPFIDVHNGQSRAPILQQTKIQILSQEECRREYFEHENLRDSLTERKFCALNKDPKGGAVCVGDSGGPFIVNSKLYGIASSGYNGSVCSQPDSPALFTRLTNIDILKWIKETFQGMMTDIRGAENICRIDRSNINLFKLNEL